MKRFSKIFSLVVLIAVATTTSLAHSGRTDSKGGHYNRKTGVYHYHNGGTTKTTNSTKTTSTSNGVKVTTDASKQVDIKADKNNRLNYEDYYYDKGLKIFIYKLKRDGKIVEGVYNSTTKRWDYVIKDKKTNKLLKFTTLTAYYEYAKKLETAVKTKVEEKQTTTEVKKDESYNLYVNDLKVEDVKVEDNKLYVPITVLKDNLNYEIKWNEELKAFVIVVKEEAKK